MCGSRSSRMSIQTCTRCRRSSPMSIGSRRTASGWRETSSDTTRGRTRCSRSCESGTSQRSAGTTTAPRSAGGGFRFNYARGGGGLRGRCALRSPSVRSRCVGSDTTSMRSPRRSVRPACRASSRTASTTACDLRWTGLLINACSMRVLCNPFSMSVQEYLSSTPPQMATRWMGMRRALLALVLAAAVAIAGVASYVYMYEGSLDVAVQDDSGAWAHVWVTFTQVWVHEAGKSEEVGWHNLTVAQASIDLASLVTVSQLLPSARAEPGQYTETRLPVVAATGRMLDGTNVVFSVPSGDVKAVTPFEIRSGATTRLTVDVDLVRSIVMNGTGWTFTPVIGQITAA